MPWFVGPESGGSRWRSALINNQSKMLSEAWAIWESEVNWGKQTITAGAGCDVYFPIENTVGGKFRSLIHQTTALHKKIIVGWLEKKRKWEGARKKCPKIQHQWFIMNKQLQPATQSQVKKGQKPFLFFFVTVFHSFAACSRRYSESKSVRSH